MVDNMKGREKVAMSQKRVWNQIAETWHRFRPTPVWEVKEFLAKAHGNVLDLGCGSGRNFIPGDYYVFGIDFSSEMLKHARKRGKDMEKKPLLAKADLCSIPFGKNTFDFVVFSASLHHVRKNKMKKCLKEMKRVMKPGAKVIITVWNKNQPLFQFSEKECFIPWNRDGKKLERYVHLFSKSELRALLESCGFRKVRITGSSHKAMGRYSKNIVAVVEK